MKECVFCKTRYQKGSGVTFHKFPSDKRRLELWLKNIKKSSWHPKKYDYICSNHFSDNCFIKHYNCTTLKKCSIGSSVVNVSSAHESMATPSVSGTGMDNPTPTIPETIALDEKITLIMDQNNTNLSVCQDNIEQPHKNHISIMSQEVVSQKEMNTADPESLMRPDPQSNSTFSVKNIIGIKTWGGRSDPPMKVIMVEGKNGEITYLPSVENQGSLNQKYVIKNIPNQKDKKQIKSELAENTLSKILKIPYFYIGIDKKSSFIINLLEKNMNIPFSHVLMCLKKIKLNNTFRELGDDFSLTAMEASKIFYKNVPVLAKIMQKFIVKIEHLLNISCIIDCLEIQIEEPCNVSTQKQTWSDHKNANTIKYLIACNPNGLVNYVSMGYGGRITDTNLVEICGFTKHLQPNMSILVNSEFKNLEERFQKLSVKLLRSSSTVEANGSMIKDSRIEAYFKTVMGRLQGFAMLRACLNGKLVKVLDDVVSVACGLINLQDNTQPTSHWWV